MWMTELAYHQPKNLRSLQSGSAFVIPVGRVATALSFMRTFLGAHIDWLICAHIVIGLLILL
jgi:hypothetical protein